MVEQSTSSEFDLARYKDEYAEKMTQIIDAAVHGKELVAAPDEEPRQVLNLLDALKASVAQGVLPSENGAVHDTLSNKLARPRGVAGKKATMKKVATKKVAAKKKASKKTATETTPRKKRRQKSA